MNLLKSILYLLTHVRNPLELIRAIVPPQWTSPLVLNLGDNPSTSLTFTDEVTPIDVKLRRLKHQLKADFIEADAVKYGALADSVAYSELTALSQRLKRFDATSLEDDNAKIAFWINLYNVLAIHGVIALNLNKSVMEIPSFFRRVSYQVGPHLLSLDQIENGLLRRNRPHPLTGQPTIPHGDKRLGLCPSFVDPRIHMALVCSSKSCPPIAFYDPERIDEQLDLATCNFVSRIAPDTNASTISMSMIFKAYADDFGGLNGGVQRFILKYKDSTTREPLRSAFDEGWPLIWQPYDWSLNALIA